MQRGSDAGPGMDGAAPHAIQLFDSHESAAHTLALFASEGLTRGEPTVLVTRLEDWNRAAVKLAADQTLTDGIMSGQLVVRDSNQTLDALLMDGWPSPDRFERVVAPLIEGYAKRNDRIRVYGDMVDLLAADGRFEAAEALEEMWNALLARLPVPVMLVCGYSSTHFCDSVSTASLERLRTLHSHEQYAPRDFVARHLLERPAS